MIKAEQNFLQSLSYTEELSKQLSEQSQKCTEIEEKIKQIAESKINYKNDEEYIELEKRKNDIVAKIDDINGMIASNFRCRQKKIDAAKAAKLNVEGQRNNRSKYCLLIKLLKFFLLLPSFYLVYIIIRSFFHVFDLDDCIMAIVNAIVIIIMIIIYFIIYSLICGILDAVNERIMRKRKVKVTPEPIKISDIDTSEYDERIDKFNLQIVELEEEFQECKNELQSYFDKKEKDKDELLKKECEHLDKVKRELDRIKNELDKSILVSEHEKYKEMLESEFFQKENVLYLNVSDNQEDEVKALGAKWNPELKNGMYLMI